MASMMRFDGDAPSIGASRHARNYDCEGDGLAAFRVHAELDSARSLSSLIETEIIPRMMVAHVNDPPAEIASVPDGAIDRADVEALAPLTLQVDADALLAHIEAVLDRGVAIDTVMIDLLAPTARLLGEYWEDDRCDFIDVTMGLWRLQEIVHEIAARLPLDRKLAAGGYRALFASMFGDHHSFGTVVVDELFRNNGWITMRINEAETSDLLKCASSDWFDVIGLTISRECHIGETPSVIAALRNVSKNPQVCVMVGGRIFSVDPDLAVQVGADGTASDAKIALKVAGDLVRSREAAHCS